MSKTLVVWVVLAAALAGFAGAHIGQRWSMGSNWGPGWGANWGPGMMRGGDGYAGYGSGPMMGRGYGPGMMRDGGDYAYGPGMMRGWRDEPEDLNLTVEQVTKRFERRLAVHGNDRVKLGTVAEKDAKTITVDIVTTDTGGLVERFTVDRKSGVMRRSDG